MLRLTSKEIKGACVLLVVVVVVVTFVFQFEGSQISSNLTPFEHSQSYSSVTPSHKTRNVEERQEPILIKTSAPWNMSREPQSISDFYRYIRWTDPKACELSTEIGGKIMTFNRFTGRDGQKKLCLDKRIAPDPRSCLVYSFGINNDWSFDDTMAQYGCDVFAFDPSMHQEDHKRSNKISFMKIGLGTKNIDKDIRGWKFRTFSTLKSQLGHTNRVIDILKIDIERNEWAVLPQIVKEGGLQKVKQLAVEIHMGAHSSVRTYIDRYWNVLRSVELEGFVKFSAEQNPFLRRTIPGLDKVDSSFYELVWLNNKYIK